MIGRSVRAQKNMKSRIGESELDDWELHFLQTLMSVNLKLPPSNPPAGN